jgi:hypothetical protein
MRIEGSHVPEKVVQSGLGGGRREASNLWGWHGSDIMR